MLKSSLVSTRFLFLISCLMFSSISFSDSSQIMRLATTTSTQNSGLLDSILPRFEKQYGYQVHVIAVGTGKALKMGQNGDVDVLMVHAPNAEKKFIKSGYGIRRYEFMYNDFILVGPENDPAMLNSAKTVKQAMSQISVHKALFISRGDDSGTHKKELTLWDNPKNLAQKEWYREAGQGMGKVLQMANELNAYTLTDRGTWLSQKSANKNFTLEIVFEGDPALFNPYGVIALNPKRFPELNHKAAQKFIDWLISPEGQQLIGAYRVNNTQLFTPSANTAQSNKVR